MTHKDIHRKLFSYEGKIWARTFLLFILILLGWQVYELDADISRRGDVFSNRSVIDVSFVPDVDNSYDLGSSSYEFKDFYLDGTANIDSLVADTADINGGTIDGITIGTNSVCTDLRVDNLKLDGNTLSTTNTNGNFVITPNGSGITAIGDAVSPDLPSPTNDDMEITGRLKVHGALTAASTLDVTGDTTILGIISARSNAYGVLLYPYGSSTYGGATYSMRWVAESVEIPVGSGLDPVVETSSNLAPANSIIKAVTVRVINAPGGGANVFSVGRSGGGNTDEFIDDISTALGTTGSTIANSDGTLTYASMLNPSAQKLTVTTDADVTVDSMIIRIVVFYDVLVNPSS